MWTVNGIWVVCVAYGWCGHAVCVDLRVVYVCGIVFPWKCGNVHLCVVYVSCVCAFCVVWVCVHSICLRSVVYVWCVSHVNVVCVCV